MKIFYQNRNNVLNDFRYYYERTTNLLDSKACILWNDLIEPQRTIISKAKEHGIRSFVMEHGMKAVSDYDPNITDISNRMGGKKLFADDIFVWGKKSQEIMLNSGVKKDNIHLVGAPIAWNHDYVYKNSQDETKVVGFNLGDTVIDPATKIQWALKGCRSYVPQRKGGNIVAFITHHDFTQYAIEQNSLIYDQIKHRPDLFIKLNDSYLNEQDNNPFKEIVQIKDETLRRDKAMFVSINSPKNLSFVKSLLQHCRAVVTTIPGTINGLCWAMNVPIIVPKIDWHWRDLKGNILYDTQIGDYVCEIDDLNETIDTVIKNDTKEDDRRQCAIDFMGIDLGNPTQNMRKVIDGNL